MITFQHKSKYKHKESQKFPETESWISIYTQIVMLKHTPTNDN